MNYVICVAVVLILLFLAKEFFVRPFIDFMKALKIEREIKKEKGDSKKSPKKN